MQVYVHLLLSLPKQVLDRTHISISHQTLLSSRLPAPPPAPTSQGKEKKKQQAPNQTNTRPFLPRSNVNRHATQFIYIGYVA